jgi:hypothetical protein
VDFALIRIDVRCQCDVVPFVTFNGVWVGDRPALAVRVAHKGLAIIGAPHFCPKCMTAMAAKMNLHGSLCVPLQILCHERNWNEDLSGPSSDPCPRAVGP